MKMPSEIVGKNRVRDLSICMDYISGKTPEEITTLRKLNLSARRIEQILYANKTFVSKHIGWDKSKRIFLLQRMIKDVTETRKDPADIIEQIRKEIEGDKPLIDNSKHLHQTYVWKDSGIGNELCPPRLPSRDTQTPSEI